MNNQDPVDNLVFIATADDKGINLKVSFDGNQYIVEVFKDHVRRQAFVPCSFTPLFGMDVLDQQACLQIAEDLALQVEQELKI